MRAAHVWLVSHLFWRGKRYDTQSTESERIGHGSDAGRDSPQERGDSQSLEPARTRASDRLQTNWLDAASLFRRRTFGFPGQRIRITLKRDMRPNRTFARSSARGSVPPGSHGTCSRCVLSEASSALFRADLSGQFAGAQSAVLDSSGNHLEAVQQLAAPGAQPHHAAAVLRRHPE